MKQSRAALAGVSKGDYRDLISALFDDGWSAEKTAGNHLKLLHPDATTPVFASSTPSCSRSAANLKTQCRRALMDSSAAYVQPPQEAPEIEQETDTPSKSRKKQRWTALDRARHEMEKEKKMKAEKIEADLAEARERDAAAAAAKKPSVAKKRPALTVVDEATRPAKAAPRRTPVKQKAACENVASNIQVIDAATLELALRIARGEMRRVEITADMVGQVLYASGDVVLTGRDAKASPAKSAKSAKTKAPVKNASVSAAKGKPQEKRPMSEPMMEVYAATSFDDWMTIRQIVEQISGATPTKNALESTRHLVRRLVDRGMLEVSSSGGVSTYRSIR